MWSRRTRSLCAATLLLLCVTPATSAANAAGTGAGDFAEHEELPRPAVGIAIIVQTGPVTSGSSGSAVRSLPSNADADYQLGGASRVPPGVSVVAREWTDPPAGDYAVCYVNAFQTQPGRLGWWRSRYPHLLLRHRDRLVVDPNWPDEVLMDISTDARRRALAAVVERWFVACTKRGFDAVEPDNLDSWTRSRGAITPADAIAYSRLLARMAHERGLAIAQKNAAALLAERESVGWDFAVAEECHVYRECPRFLRAYDNAVVEIEYTDAGGRSNFRRACRSHGDRIAIVYRDRDLVPHWQTGYVYDSC